jgi:ABC-type nickel/cobalt efflux system permease component RcnA
VLDLRGALPDGWRAGAEASFRDDNYADRIGWRQVVIRGGPGVKLAASSAPAADETAELTSYPAEGLKTPPAVREARFRFLAGESGTTIATAPAVQPEARGEDKTLDGFAGLIAEQTLTPAIVVLALFGAAAWGAAHALGPGHGKTIVAAYLVGSRGTARHALLLGLTVTATHTSSVVALGLVTLYASAYFSADDLYVWLSVASGLTVAAMGAFLFASRLRRALRGRAVAPHSHGAGHSHAHSLGGQGHPHDHVHVHDGHGHHHDLPAEGSRLGLHGLIALGVSGGIVPCPTALVVMLAAIALDRVAYGLVLILCFSIGLAGVLTGIGLLVVFAQRALAVKSSPRVIERARRVLRWPVAARLIGAVPAVSALAIFVVGLVLMQRALFGLF